MTVSLKHDKVALGTPPVRGTQSFVGVMVEVFRRPSLTGLEALWRWSFWCAVLAWPAQKLYPVAMLFATGVQAGGIGSWASGLPVGVWRDGVPHGMRWAVCAALLWVVASALGRTLLLWRIAPGLRPRVGALVGLGALRWVWWAGFVGLWLAVVRGALVRLVVTPQGQGGEAAWVPFCAVLIVSTLLLFVLWLGTSWVFGLASVYAARLGTTAMASLRAAWQSGAVRSKVAEINLVMGIVKIALLVLAMVFSACPLPFESVETQGFLVIWTAAVLLLYFVASDYFHVVRLMAFLRMAEVMAEPVPSAAALGGEVAS